MTKRSMRVCRAVAPKSASLDAASPLVASLLGDNASAGGALPLPAPPFTIAPLLGGAVARAENARARSARRRSKRTAHKTINAEKKLLSGNTSDAMAYVHTFGAKPKKPAAASAVAAVPPATTTEAAITPRASDERTAWKAFIARLGPTQVGSTRAPPHTAAQLSSAKVG